MSDNKQLYRILGQRLPASVKRRLVLLTGARQTGKTTLAKAKYARLRYINLDAPENRDVVRNVSSNLWARDIGAAILDEAQKEPIIFDKVKYAYDDGSLLFSILMGSSQILLLKKIRETLAGRVSIFELWPLMMCEIFNDSEAAPNQPPLVDSLFSSMSCDDIFGKQPGLLLEDEDSLRRRAQDYLLQWGGMPALIALSEEERRQWLKDYEYTYLERDVADLARLDDLMLFRKFQRLAALRSGCLLNYAELARDAAVSVDTARRYLEYLRLSYQTVLLPPYHSNLTSTVIKTPKTYWLDIGLLRHLTGVRGSVTGEIYESMVAAELVKWMKTMGRDGDLYFYRTRSGLEVDILLESPAGVIGMEIKSRKILANKDTSGLKEIASALGKRWRGGIIIYSGNELKRVAAPQIWAVPSHRLFTSTKS
ncbi:MAG TPA: ATP-binding protein [Smithella sp.]|nr:ATP-binding protein [Smithella sp.]